MMTERDLLLRTWERELATTLKVLEAFPAGWDDFRPAEKSPTAKGLVWSFIGEQGIAMAVCSGGLDFSKPFPEMPPGTVADLIPMLEKSSSETLAKVRALSQADLERTTDFFVGPRQMAKIRILDVLWTMVMDMIHHRGQFTIYLRMVGAKVPSVYGPTADEPWM